ncbi:hypothetical protein [Bacillus altitudinis]|uniref:hypothetical protein n=1 Tax=Bacillus altitudinis TaxID=293387 RepID=UPI00228099B1|nr:hypothetical protein [Bacillus altitudinis]MCY7454316.1 hypothetical protein [Bacillus altitudinis]
MNIDDLKEPKDMVNMELLEAYSAFNRKGFRTIEEQNYLGQLRQVILERMSEKESNKEAIIKASIHQNGGGD